MLDLSSSARAASDPAMSTSSDQLGRARRKLVTPLRAAVLVAIAGALAATFSLVALADHDRAAARPQRSVPHRAKIERRRARIVVRHRDHHRPAAKHRQGQPVAGLPVATVTIDANAGVIAVPRSFLGVSTEYWSLPLFERNDAAFERYLTMLRVPGDGPLVLRIGGDSADHAFWDPLRRHMASWIFPLTPKFLERMSTLVSDVGAKVILDLNLVTDSPQKAAQWARVAEQNLPRGSIIGFEIGNEPDIYSRWDWLLTIPRRDSDVLPVSITAARYVEEFRAYARALARVAPGVPLIGPAIANPKHHVNWVAALIAGAGRSLGMVSAHRYPFSACVDRFSGEYPTIQRLLSPEATSGLAETIRPAVRLAHRAGLPLRLTELNSVTCGGLAGVSNSFATALWAPDALFELMQAGVNGVNIHTRANTINAPFDLIRAGLAARPLLYGLALFVRTLSGADSKLVNLQLHVKRSLNVKAWAVQIPGSQLHVLVLDKSDHAVRVTLALPATGPATVQRMLAPSAAARSGVTLAGQHLAPNGQWVGRPVEQTIRPTDGHYQLTMPGISAALLDVALSTSSTLQ
jgi:hypothetical protein